MFYDLASSSWDEKEIQALNSVIESGFFTMSDNVRHFEERFSAYMGMKFGVMVNSGSSANLIAVASLFYTKNNPLKRGDEVIVPAVSWTTTYTPLQQYGLKLKFVDIDLETLNVDIQQLEQAISPETKALVGVSILGNPAELDQMRSLADKHNLHFIEDNCESMDAELNGQKAGTFGDLCTYSFFFSHHISTMEGGMILTNDPELYELCLSLRAHGWTRDLPDNSQLLKKRDDAVYEAYRFILPGYNVRPTELNAAVGLAQLEKLPELTRSRRKNLQVFQILFSNDPRFIIQRENGKSSAFCFTIVLNPDCQLDRRLAFNALAEADIGFRIITGGCFTEHEVIEHFDYCTHDDLPNARWMHYNGFFVGNAPVDLTEQLQTLYNVLDACYA